MVLGWFGINLGGMGTSGVCSGGSGLFWDDGSGMMVLGWWFWGGPGVVLGGSGVVLGCGSGVVLGGPGWF